MTGRSGLARSNGAAWTRSRAAPNVVVGLGSEIACDDGVGVEVARILEHEFEDRDDVDVFGLPWGGFALLDVLRDRKRAAVVDCLVSGSHPPGTVVRLTGLLIPGSVRLNSFHDISFPTVIDLGRHMGWEMPGDIAIWGIEAENAHEFGERLSPAVAAAVPQVVEYVKQFIGIAEREVA